MYTPADQPTPSFDHGRWQWGEEDAAPGARYADICNLFGASTVDVAHKLDMPLAHREGDRRDYDRIDKAVLALRSPLTDPEAFLALLGECAALGISEVVVMPDGIRSSAPS